MNTAELSRYAPQAREDFMAAMRLQAGRIGVRADGCSPVESQGEAIVIDGVTSISFKIGLTRQDTITNVICIDDCIPLCFIRSFFEGRSPGPHADNG